jgi:prepilin signal peptidase PulO-like enzyme (type II secretory pathway)
MPRRSRPLTIAPLIPLLAIIGFLGVNQLHRSRFLTVFVIVWSLLFAALLIYVFTKMMEAKRARSGR